VNPVRHRTSSVYFYRDIADIAQRERLRLQCAVVLPILSIIGAFCTEQPLSTICISSLPYTSLLVWMSVRLGDLTDDLNRKIDCAIRLSSVSNQCRAIPTENCISDISTLVQDILKDLYDIERNRPLIHYTCEVLDVVIIYTLNSPQISLNNLKYLARAIKKTKSDLSSPQASSGKILAPSPEHILVANIRSQFINSDILPQIEPRIDLSLVPGLFD
jgi:hypothetical protein